MERKRTISKQGFCNSCYFRTSVAPPFRKALLQITEKCNLTCRHCFLDSSTKGKTISLYDIENVIWPQLKALKVISLTITGGEPFVHPNIEDVVKFLSTVVDSVTICTNATIITETQMELFSSLGNIKFNVSLDSFSKNGYESFRRGGKFIKVINNIKLISQYKLLNGILVTPNQYSQVEEYKDLIGFSKALGAKYVLMNPIAKMGRGENSAEHLNFNNDCLKTLSTYIEEMSDSMEVIKIRFPNNKKPLLKCEASNIIYIFCNGDVTVCPYLMFAAKSQVSKHKPEDFIIGNVYSSNNLKMKLDKYNVYEKYDMSNNNKCHLCQYKNICGRGCPAAIVASGNMIGDIDIEMCPIHKNNSNYILQSDIHKEKIPARNLR